MACLAVSRKKKGLYVPYLTKYNPDNKYLIDQACSVKIAGYYDLVLFCVFMEHVLMVHKNAKKKKNYKYPTLLTDQDWTMVLY